jgi:hypothetical protein
VAWVGLLLLFYATSTRLIPGASDRATVILQGQAMSRGNWLLHGWILTRDSLWLSDSLLFALMTPIVGVRPGLLNFEPAVLLALTVAVGMRIAVYGRRGGAAIAGTAVVLALLTFPAHAMAELLLGGETHLSTVLLALVAFAALRRRQIDWRWAIGVAALTVGMVSDLLMVAYGLVPVFLAGLFSMLRERNWRAGIAATSASVVGAVVAAVFTRLAAAAGGFTLGPAVQVVIPHERLANLRRVPHDLASLLGFTHSLYGTGGVPVMLERVHWIAAALVVACSLACLAFFVRDLMRPGRGGSGITLAESESRWLDSVLLIAMCGPPITFIYLGVARPTAARYLYATVVFASVLAGRVVARGWARLPSGWPTRAVIGAAAVISLCFATGLGYVLAQGPAVQATRQVAAFLEAHHLRYGVGDYWSSSIITVETGEAVVVRPVRKEHGGDLGRSYYESAVDWYAGQQFQFLVYAEPDYQGVDGSRATRTWGRPAHEYVVGTYHVFVWPKPFRVAPYPKSPP